MFFGIRDPRSGIRDPGWEKPGSGIRDKHPGSATLKNTIVWFVHTVCIYVQL